MMLRRVFCAGALAVTASLGSSWGAELAGTDDAPFEKLHALIKRQPGESRWMEIDWYPTVWEARRKAAAEGKPLFLMAGSGGAPAAGC
jgi:hypothetical protein